MEKCQVLWPETVASCLLRTSSARRRAGSNSVEERNMDRSERDRENALVLFWMSNLEIGIWVGKLMICPNVRSCGRERMLV